MRHLLGRTGEKPVICEVCNKGFFLKYILKTHNNIYTKHETFISKVYSEGFSKKHK